MTIEKLLNISKKINTKITEKKYLGTTVNFINETAIAYRYIDNFGKQTIISDLSKFPKSFNSQYILDCIEIKDPDLGIIKEQNFNYFKNDTFVIADIETTGFSPDKGGRIIEIGAVKINENGDILDKFSKFVNPGLKIPDNITKLTGITNDMVKNSDYIGTVINEFWGFIKGSVMVFHNAKFDWDRFLVPMLKSIGILIPDNYPVLDTMELDKILFPNEQKHTLDKMCERLEIEVIDHHRAISDAEMTGKAFVKIKDKLQSEFKNLPMLRWNTQKKELNIRITNNNLWEKKKKDGTLLKQRYYITFVCNGIPGTAYFDVLENCWYMQNCRLSFNVNELNKYWAPN